MTAPRFLAYNKSGRKRGEFRNKTEQQVASFLNVIGKVWSYESERIPYVLHRHYTPDFLVEGLIIEVKGWWPAPDRQKVLAVVQQHPDADILVLLQRPDHTINARSKTTYAQWCDKKGISWAPVPKTADELRRCLDAHRSRNSTSRAHGAIAQMELPSGKTAA